MGWDQRWGNGRSATALQMRYIAGVSASPRVASNDDDRSNGNRLNPCNHKGLGTRSRGLSPSDKKALRGVEPTWNCFAGSRLTVWLQRHVIQYPRQESNLVLDLRRVACDPQHSRTYFLQRPAEESNLVRQFRGLPCSSGTPTGRSFQCLDQDLNLDQDLRRVLCDPLHHRDVFNEHPDLESNQVQGFRKALCDPLHHRDNHRTRADDWSCTSIERFTGPPPFSIEPRRQQARARGVEPRAAGLESACSPRSTLVYRLRSRRTGGVRVTTTPSASRSSTLR